MLAGDKEVIKHLNNALGHKLTAINQYFLHARMMKHMGFMELADYEYKESIQQMKYADKLVERVLFIGGIPNLQEIGKLNIGETVEEILKCDLKLEETVCSGIRSAIFMCESKGDGESSHILNSVIENAEEHIAFINKQLNLIDSINLPKYLQTEA
jgi:bacterioferritin